MGTSLDTALVDSYTAGANMPLEAQAGYAARANAAGTNIDYVKAAQIITGSGAWDGESEAILVFGSGARTITLGRGDIIGRKVEVVDAAGTSGAGDITIDPDGTDTVNGATTMAITSNYTSRVLIYAAVGVWVRSSG